MRRIGYLKFGDRPDITATEDNPIECFTKNGEMAPVDWFMFGNIEFNGKYVTEIGYYEDSDNKKDKE